MDAIRNFIVFIQMLVAKIIEGRRQPGRKKLLTSLSNDDIF
ncbi:hypothetical protein T260_12040 [Geobacillus thermopakistaniensis]|uniref:Uncharacterized protein n=1 Tax=Geobacillus thermopakistaniensis (strain MAS1) TaxID=1408282 RepID=A0A7U9J9X0_GEOTM|nr:hypothetical protein GA8_12000 [Geobacillus sp. A8]ESU71690.1 hypothetical protein T260_12040 [Geobacillus sp. MAS1]